MTTAKQIKEQEAEDAIRSTNEEATNYNRAHRAGKKALDNPNNLR